MDRVLRYFAFVVHSLMRLSVDLDNVFWVCLFAHSFGTILIMVPGFSL